MPIDYQASRDPSRIIHDPLPKGIAPDSEETMHVPLAPAPTIPEVKLPTAPTEGTTTTEENEQAEP